MTESELLEALREALEKRGDEDDDGAMTSQELADRLGVSVRQIRPRLKALKEQGRLEVCRVKRHSLDNEWRVVPGYRLLGGDDG